MSARSSAQSSELLMTFFSLDCSRNDDPSLLCGCSRSNDLRCWRCPTDDESALTDGANARWNLARFSQHPLDSQDRVPPARSSCGSSRAPACWCVWGVESLGKHPGGRSGDRERERER